MELVQGYAPGHDLLGGNPTQEQEHTDIIYLISNNTPKPPCPSYRIPKSTNHLYPQACLTAADLNHRAPSHAGASTTGREVPGQSLLKPCPAQELLCVLLHPHHNISGASSFPSTGNTWPVCPPSTWGHAVLTRAATKLEEKPNSQGIEKSQPRR